MDNNFYNPLDRYRSFSYHYIMTVSNTTEAHRKLISVNNGRAAFLDIVNNVELGGQLNMEQSAYLLLDTRRFSQFSVQSFTTDQIYGSGPIENPSKPASMSALKLFDATGLSFYNFLMDILQNKLKATRTSALFMLAVMFIGHKDDGTTEKISECFIPMLMMSMGFDFTFKGTEFEITLLETNGNPSAGQPAMADLGGILSVSTEGRPNTVGGMIQCFEDSLNSNSLAFYQKYTNKALEIANDAQKSKFSQAGKLVQYMITIPREWREFKIDTATQSKHIEQVFKAGKVDAESKANKVAAQVAVNGGSADDVSKARNSYLSFADNMTIFDAIKIILESSQEYLELGSLENRLAGKATVHKTMLSVTSDDRTYVLHYDVIPFQTPKTKIETTTGNNPSAFVSREVIDTGQKNNPRKNNKNLIEYDYIFTGKNSQIIDLKINFIPEAVVGLDRDVDIGQKRFARVATAGSHAGQMQQRQDSLKRKTKDFATMVKPGDPLFMPPKTSDESTGMAGVQTEEMTQDEALKAQYRKQDHTSTLAFFHFASTQQLQVTIRGNPNLLKKYADVNTRGGIAKHPASLIGTDVLKNLVELKQDARQVFSSTVSKTLKNAKDEYFDEHVQPMIDKTTGSIEEGNGLKGGDISTGPVYVKLNIRAPNVDFNGNPVDSGALFTDKFFYSGAYMVLQITHTFSESGAFTQTLMLTPADFDGSYSASAIAT
jgi:hypothetical protein